MSDVEKFEYSPKIERVLHIINELRKITPSNEIVRISEHTEGLNLSYYDLSLIIRKLNTLNISILAIETHEITQGFSYDSWDITIGDENKFNEFVINYSKQKENKHQRGNGVIKLFNDGRIEYSAPSGQTYKAKFKLNTNSFLLLRYLALNLNKSFNAHNLNRQLKDPKHGGENSTSDRRIRDVIKDIRAKLRTTKEDDLFNLESGLFGLRSDVFFIK